MRFILFVEGRTEMKAVPAFLKRWLDERLPQRVGITPVRFDGWPELRSKVAERTHHYINGPRGSDIIAVISLLDLYGPTFYPPHLTTADEKYEWAKAKIEKDVDLPTKFRQFFAVHETEAWLLSQPGLFDEDVRGGFPGRISQPETVNFNEPPSKLLERLYRAKLRRTYKKVVNGKELFDRLDPKVAYNRCPRLKGLLDEMLRLAEDAMR